VQACFEHVPAGLLLFNSDGMITAANPVAVALLALPSNTAVPGLAVSLLDPVLGDTRAAVMQPGFAGLGSRRCRIVQDSGKAIEAGVEVHPLTADAFLATLLDLTHRHDDGVPSVR